MKKVMFIIIILFLSIKINAQENDAKFFIVNFMDAMKNYEQLDSYVINNKGLSINFYMVDAY